jgi:competence protein ComEA
MRHLLPVLLFLCLAVASGHCHEPVPAPAGTAPGSAAAAPLDLNAATAEQLETLPGIGPALAARIVAYRDEHGPFTRVEQLDNVKGIGAQTLTKLRPSLIVQ